MPPPHPEAVAAAASDPSGSLAQAPASAAEQEELPKAAEEDEQQKKHHQHLAPLPPPFAPFLIPFSNVKVLTLIRHAQGYHNAAGERDKESYKDELYRDAHLTKRGWKQALAAGAHWRSVYSSGQGSRPELVVVSPLTRTLETASAIFGEEAEEEEGGDGGGDNSSRRRPLMLPRPAVPGRVAPAPAFSSPRDSPPFVAHELCREESGLHPCDGRRPTSEKRRAFPGVDFSLIESERDPIYDSCPPGERESKDSVKARAVEFARWLLARPERHIAVVSHAGFLHFFARAVGAPQFHHHQQQQKQQQQQQQHGEGLTSPLTKWFENAEARVVVLADAGGGGGEEGAPPLAFAGGGFDDAEEEDEEKR